MRYLVCGDVHAQWPSFYGHIVAARRGGIKFDQIIQVGDMGIYPGTMTHLYRIFEKDTTTAVHFIDGNHECHPYLRKTVNKLPDRINWHYHPRGDITTLDDGTVIGWMGGALNADRAQEEDGGGNYFNIPTGKVVNNFIKTVNKKELKIDLMVTHSCPPSIGIGISGHPALISSVQQFIGDIGFPVAPIEDCGDFFLTPIYRELIDKPKTWAFGHFHVLTGQQVDQTHFQCVGMIGNIHATRFYVYDTETKQLRWGIPLHIPTDGPRFPLT